MWNSFQLAKALATGARTALAAPTASSMRCSVAATDGYASMTVAKILAAAQVSRATFYQYFTHVDDCFRSAYRHHAARLIEESRERFTQAHDPD